MYLDFDGLKVVLAPSLHEKLKKQLGDGKSMRFPENVFKLYEMENGQKKRMGPKGRRVQYTDVVSLEIMPENWRQTGEIKDVFYSEGPKSQQVRVTYYESSTRAIKNQDVKNYKPGSYDKPGTIQPHETAKWFFLSVCSRAVKGSDNAKNNTRKRFMMEIFDPAADATSKVKEGMYEALVRAKILAPEEMGGLSINKLKDIGATMFISEKEWKTADQLRIAIIEKAKVDEIVPGLSGGPKKGWEYVMFLINTIESDSMEKRVNIMKAKDAGVIYFNVNKQAWFYCDPAIKNEIREIEQICLVPGGSLDPVQTLISFMNIGKNYDRLLESLKYANVTPGLAVNNEDNIRNRIKEVKNGNGKEEELVPLYIELTNLNRHPTYVGELNKLAEKYPEVYKTHEHMVKRPE